MSAMAHEPAVILIIDNDPIMLTGIAAILNMSGYECHCARNSVAAMKAVKSLALDLIICDVELGSENGIEICAQLREQPGIEDVPMMFISSAQTPDIVRRSHAAGASYYLRKPFDTEVLIELVGKALWMPHLIQSHTSAMPQTTAEVTPATSAVPRSNMRHALSGIRMPMA